MTWTSDGSPGELVGSGVQLVGWENGKPIFKNPNLDDLADVNTAGAGVGDFLGWNGTGWSPNSPSGTGGAASYAASGLDTITTSATTFGQMPNMVVSGLPFGNYHALFSATASHSRNSESVIAAIFVNGVEALESEREIGGQAGNKGNLNCQALVEATGVDNTIEVRWKASTNQGQATIFQRLLIATQVDIMS
jgi:hypothetical protein